jgi:hypothetical protein
MSKLIKTVWILISAFIIFSVIYGCNSTNSEKDGNTGEKVQYTGTGIPSNTAVKADQTPVQTPTPTLTSQDNSKHVPKPDNLRAIYFPAGLPELRKGLNRL